MSAYCQYFIANVGLVSVHDRRGRLSVGIRSSMSGVCRYVFGEVVLYSGPVRQGLFIVGT